MAQAVARSHEDHNTRIHPGAQGGGVRRGDRTQDTGETKGSTREDKGDPGAAGCSPVRHHRCFSSPRVQGRRGTRTEEVFAASVRASSIGCAGGIEVTHGVQGSSSSQGEIWIVTN